jgi:uncharacterized protein (DUF1330 family)
MKRGTKLAIGLAGTLAAGAGGIGALHAQATTKPAYIVADVDIFDQAGYQAYGAKVPPTLKAYNGRIIVRGKPSPKEGATPQGIIVMLEFDSLANAEKWWNSPEYSALIPERQKAAKAQIYIVEGLPR